MLLKKVWDVDALKCPKCGGQMKIISFIEQPFVIRHILKHLDLWEDPRHPPEPLEMDGDTESTIIGRVEQLDDPTVFLEIE